MGFRRNYFSLVEDIKVTLVHYKCSAPCETEYERGRRDAIVEELQELLNYHYARMEILERNGYIEEF